MKLGVMGSSIVHMGWDKALDFCQHLGLDAIEIPTGAYPKKHLFPPEQVIDSPGAQQQIKDDLARRGLTISALSCHGNAVHPDPAEAKRHEEAHDLTVRLAAQLGVGVVNTFSGCPGGSPQDRTPNWVTCVWPPEFPAILEYQWHDVLFHFWERKARQAADAGIRIAIEPHPGFAVYNPETLLKLRGHAGDAIGTNFDPSHFFWQGIDPVEAARVLGDAGAIYHIHAKDTAIDPHNTKRNGVLDTKSYGDLHHRSWVFRTCGYGHGDEFWKPFISMLRVKGYDYVLSVEHEDSSMSGQEGLTKAVEYLKPMIIRDPADRPWWF